MNKPNNTDRSAIGAYVGYKRVSSVDQSTDRQLEGLQLDRVFEEKISAKAIDRPVFNECLDYLRSGDCLVIHSLDRVCRSGAGDAVALVTELTNKGIGIEFVKEGMRFDADMTAVQKGLLSILASVAEMERGLIKERQLEGISLAKAAGKYKGRPATKTKSLNKDDFIKAISNSSMAQACKDFGISRQTGYRLIGKQY